MKKIYFVISFVFLFPFLSNANNLGSLDSLHSCLQQSKGVEKVSLLIELSEHNRNISFKDCKDYAEQAIVLAKELTIDSLAGLASKSLGVSYFLIGDMPNSLKYFQKGYEFYKKTKDKKGISNCLNNMGLVYEGWSQFDKAFNYYWQSYEIEKELKNEKGMATSLINLGNINYYKKQYLKALDDFFQALNHYSVEDDLYGVGQAYLSMGVIYNQLQDYPKAIEFFQKSGAIYTKTGNLRDLSRSLNNLAGIYNEHFKQYKKALLLYEKVLQINTNLGSKVGIALVKNNLGVLYGHIGNLQQADTNFNESLTLYKSLNDKAGQCMVFFNRGSALLEAAKPKQAIGNYQKSLYIAKEIGLNQYIMDSFKGLFKCYAALGNYNHFNKFYQLYESTRDTVTEKARQTQISELETRYKVESLVKKDHLLQQENQQKTIELRHLHFLLAIVISGLILLIVGFVLYRYIKKARAEIKQNKLQDS